METFTWLGLRYVTVYSLTLNAYLPSVSLSYPFFWLVNASMLTSPVDGFINKEMPKNEERGIPGSSQASNRLIKFHTLFQSTEITTNLTTSLFCVKFSLQPVIERAQ